MFESLLLQSTFPPVLYSFMHTLSTGDDMNKYDLANFDSEYESQSDHNGYKKPNHVDKEKNENVSVTDSVVENVGCTNNAHFQLHQRHNESHTTDQDLKAMIRRLVNLPASTTITVQHLLKFICLQMLQIIHLNEEPNLYKEKQKEQRRKKILPCMKKMKGENMRNSGTTYKNMEICQH